MYCLESGACVQKWKASEGKKGMNGRRRLEMEMVRKEMALSVRGRQGGHSSSRDNAQASGRCTIYRLLYSPPVRPVATFFVVFPGTFPDACGVAS